MRRVIDYHGQPAHGSQNATGATGPTTANKSANQRPVAGGAGSADHRADRSFERRELSLAAADRGVRSTGRLGGRGIVFLCPLAELQVRSGLRRCSREGAGDACAGGSPRGRDQRSGGAARGSAAHLASAARMDYDLAVSALQQQVRRAQDVSAETSDGPRWQQWQENA